MLPPRRSLSDCVSFSSVCLKSAGRKVTPSWSQQVRQSNGGWPAAIANVQTFVFVFVYTHKKIIIKEDVKLLIQCLGTLRSFGDVLPEFQVFPGVFQSYMVWDLGTPGSQEEQIMTKPSPGTRDKGREMQSETCCECSWKS